MSFVERGAIDLSYHTCTVLWRKRTLLSTSFDSMRILRNFASERALCCPGGRASTHLVNGKATVDSQRKRDKEIKREREKKREKGRGGEGRKTRRKIAVNRKETQQQE